MKTMDLYTNKAACCGCGVCADACSKHIIIMKADNDGFLYPSIVDENKCLNCKLCQKVCPIKDNNDKDTSFMDYYAASLNETKDLVSCASGGFATAISRAFINRQGIVYGVSYSDDWKEIKFKRCNTLGELENLKTSKYAQANKGDSYRQICKDLQNGLDVLFIGLPCEVAAVKNLFKKANNLYTVELVCHGPTSPKVHKDFCDDLETRFQSKLTFISTRHKLNGKWKPFYLKADFENGKTFYQQFHNSSYGVAFRFFKRPSCIVCKIKDEKLQGDLMIGDYHYAEVGMAGFNPNGTSSVLVHNEKGRLMLSLLNSSISLTKIHERAALANRAIHTAISSPPKAEKFARIYRKSGLSYASSLNFVKFNKIKRVLKENVMCVGVKVKRLLLPSSRPR